MRKDNLTAMVSEKPGDYAQNRGNPEYAKLVTAGTEIYARGPDKEDGFAADRIGAVLAARAGCDPCRPPAVFQTLASINPKDDAVSLTFKTHPDSEKRLERVTDAIEGRLDKDASQPEVSGGFSMVKKSHLCC